MIKLKEHIYSTMVVSASDKFNEQLPSLLPESIYHPVQYAQSINSAQRKCSERSYDLVIINAPLPDDFGVKFAIDVSSNKTTVAMLFVRNDLYSYIYDKTCDYGVFVVRKPASAQTITMALDWLKATREKMRFMESKTLTLQEKMDEIKIVNRAKWALINSLNMTETEAHRYIEKQAMDRCVTRREIAEGIIKSYT